MLARLKRGMAIQQAQAEMNTIAGRLEKQYPDTDKDWRVKLIPLQEQLVAGRPALLILMGAVGFVLLIACANVANLLLAKAAAREKEIAVCSALGASRRRVARQLLTESVLLGLVGVVLALWIVDIMRGMLSSINVPRALEISLDGHVLGFTSDRDRLRCCAGAQFDQD